MEIIIQNQMMRKLPAILLMFVLSNTLIMAQTNHILTAEADSIAQKSSNVPPPYKH